MGTSIAGWCGGWGSVLIPMLHAQFTDKVEQSVGAVVVARRSWRVGGAWFRLSTPLDSIQPKQRCSKLPNDLMIKPCCIDNAHGVVICNVKLCSTFWWTENNFFNRTGNRTESNHGIPSRRTTATTINTRFMSDITKSASVAPLADKTFKTLHVVPFVGTVAVTLPWFHVDTARVVIVSIIFNGDECYYCYKPLLSSFPCRD